ncbi:MAG: DUF2442 domain-containing protein [Nitrospinae bacterium]|nr:DUF2442 domain-containing protein [Nitrospinota bacterium]MBF0635231.1 DUF2442 domain-containing protein [Nitrospinota bacterium]
MPTKADPSEDSTVGITPSSPWRIVEVVPLSGYRLAVKFVDGARGEVDLNPMIMDEPAGVFASLRDHDLFNKVYLDCGAPTWPGGLDIAPDAIYDEIGKG